MSFQFDCHSQNEQSTELLLILLQSSIGSGLGYKDFTLSVHFKELKMQQEFNNNLYQNFNSSDTQKPNDKELRSSFLYSKSQIEEPNPSNKVLKVIENVPEQMPANKIQGRQNNINNMSNYLSIQQQIINKSSLISQIETKTENAQHYFNDEEEQIKQAMKESLLLQQQQQEQQLFLRQQQQQQKLHEQFKQKQEQQKFQQQLQQQVNQQEQYKQQQQQQQEQQNHQLLQQLNIKNNIGLGIPFQFKNENPKILSVPTCEMQIPMKNNNLDQYYQQIKSNNFKASPLKFEERKGDSKDSIWEDECEQNFVSSIIQDKTKKNNYCFDDFSTITDEDSQRRNDLKYQKRGPTQYLFYLEKLTIVLLKNDKQFKSAIEEKNITLEINIKEKYIMFDIKSVHNKDKLIEYLQNILGIIGNYEKYEKEFISPFEAKSISVNSKICQYFKNLKVFQSYDSNEPKKLIWISHSRKQIQIKEIVEIFLSKHKSVRIFTFKDLSSKGLDQNELQEKEKIHLDELSKARFKFYKLLVENCASRYPQLNLCCPQKIFERDNYRLNFQSYFLKEDERVFNEVKEKMIAVSKKYLSIQLHFNTKPLNQILELEKNSQSIYTHFNEKEKVLSIHCQLDDLITILEQNIEFDHIEVIEKGDIVSKLNQMISQHLTKSHKHEGVILLYDLPFFQNILYTLKYASTPSPLS